MGIFGDLAPTTKCISGRFRRVKAPLRRSSTRGKLYHFEELFKYRLEVNIT